MDERPVARHAEVAVEAPDLHALVERALEVRVLLRVEEPEDGVVERPDRAHPARRDAALLRETGEGSDDLFAGIESQDVAAAPEVVVSHAAPTEHARPATAGGTLPRGVRRVKARDPMRVHVVANPTAGRGRVPRLVDAVRARLVAAGATVTTHLTSGRGDARAHVSGLSASSFDRLVVVGGDGTLHEVVNALPPPLPWPVAIVPVGTANLVARDAGLPVRGHPDRLARIVLEGRPWPIDLLETDRGLVLAVAGVGLDAEIVSAVARARRGQAGGYLRWIRPIARAFLDYTPPDLEVIVDDGPVVRGGAVVVQNTRCYGGLFTLHPGARLDDGRLDVAVFLDATRRDWFRLVAEAFVGRIAKDRGVRLLSGTSVVVRSSRPALVQMDGDPAAETPLSVRVLPRALTLLR